MPAAKPLNIYLTGGFLGSGKTTAIANACLQLTDQHKTVGVITNDQGEQLVDNGYLQSLHINSREVTNGCFCCNYNELEKQVAQLNDSAATEFIFAESVGSCTDLVATVAKPFAAFHPGYKIVITVFADAALLLAVVKGNASFVSEDIQYIYKKQIEESDILVFNKKDLLGEDELKALKSFSKENLPGKKILYQDSGNKEDIARWLKQLEEFPANTVRTSLQIDYDKYGAGEAALAWLDKTISVHTVNPVAVDAAMRLIETIRSGIRKSGYAVGHLKFLLDNQEGWVKKISYTATDKEQHYTVGEQPCKHLDMLINARVETAPANLNTITNNAIEQTITEKGCRIVTNKAGSFKPGYPKPTHRFN